MPIDLECQTEHEKEVVKMAQAIEERMILNPDSSRISLSTVKTYRQYLENLEEELPLEVQQVLHFAKA